MESVYTVLADDLSGAAEIGAVALRHGLTAAISLGTAAPGAEKVTIRDMNTRCRPEEDIPSIVADTLLRLPLETVSGRLYKKVDSVLRGHILSELTELLRRTPKRRALLVPVNPVLGRIIENGTYLINGVPIDRTDFRNDPQHPIRTSDVVEILRPRPDLLPVTVVRLGDALPEAGIIVGEANAPGDLRAWARRLDRDTLPAGGAAFLEAILRDAGYLDSETSYVTDKGNHLLVSGSTSVTSALGIRRLLEIGIPVLSMPDSVFEEEELPLEPFHAWVRDTIAAFERSPLVAVTIGRSPASDPRRGGLLSSRLAQLAGAVLKTVKVSQISIEGGETASRLVDAIGWQRLRLYGQIDATIAQLVPEGMSLPILNLKPGSYPWPPGVPLPSRKRHGVRKGPAGSGEIHTSNSPMKVDEK